MKMLSSANLNIPSGECFAIFGPGGSGKSLLLKLMKGDKSNELKYNFEDITTPDPNSIIHFDFNKNKKKHNGEFSELEFEYFLIDEPENGFSVDIFQNHFNKLRDKNRTIIFVTHHLEFLERFADRIMVLHYGAYKGTYTNYDFFNNTDPYIAYIAKMGC